MKYFVVLYATYNNGTADKKAIYEANSSDDAIKQVYKYMGSYTDADGVASVICEAKNSVGGTYKAESWIAPVSSPEAVIE